MCAMCALHMHFVHVQCKQGKRTETLFADNNLTYANALVYRLRLRCVELWHLLIKMWLFGVVRPCGDVDNKVPQLHATKSVFLDWYVLSRNLLQYSQSYSLNGNVFVCSKSTDRSGETLIV